MLYLTLLTTLAYLHFDISLKVSLGTHTKEVGIFIWIALNLQINLGLTPLSLPIYEHGILLGIRIIVIVCFVFYINGFFYICSTLDLWGLLILWFVTMFFCCVLLHCVHISQFIYPFCCWWAFVWFPHSLKPQYEHCYYQYTCSHVSMNICIHFLWYMYISHLIFKLKWKVLCLWLLPLLIQQSTPSTLSCIKCLFLLWDIFLDLIYFPLVHFSDSSLSTLVFGICPWKNSSSTSHLTIVFLCFHKCFKDFLFIFYPATLNVFSGMVNLGDYLSILVEIEINIIQQIFFNKYLLAIYCVTGYHLGLAMQY